MNRKIFTGIMCFLIIASASAQQSPARTREKKEEITIKNKKEGSEKMTIVIDGDKITVNGKPIAEYKGDDIIIRHKELERLGGTMEHDMERMHEDMAKMERELHRSMAPRMRELERMKIRTYPGPGSENFEFDFNFDGSPDMKAAIASKPRAQLGVSMEKVDKGIKVSEVISGSAAAKAGLKDGDIITRFNGKAVTVPEDLASMVKEKKPGDEVEITYLPVGQKKEKKIKVKLTETSGSQVFSFRTPSPKVYRAPRAYSMPRVAPMTPGWEKEFNEDMLRGERDGQYFRYENRRPMFGIRIQDTEDSSGVKVLDVDEGSLAANAGVQENDIITHIDGRQVKDTDDAREALQAVQEKNQYPLSLKRNGTPVALQVKVPVKLKKAEL